MNAPRKAGGRPEETARHFPPILCAAVPGLRDAVLLDFLSPRSPFHTEHTPTCSHLQEKEEWAPQRERESGHL